MCWKQQKTREEDGATQSVHSKVNLTLSLRYRSLVVKITKFRSALGSLPFLPTIITLDTHKISAAKNYNYKTQAGGNNLLKSLAIPK